MKFHYTILLTLLPAIALCATAGGTITFPNSTALCAKAGRPITPPISKGPRQTAVSPQHSPDATGGNACDRPELLQADQLTDSTARLTWADVGNAYEIELRELGQPFTGVPNYSVNADPPFEVSGLIPGQQYRFQVRTVCDSVTVSTWSTPRTFATELNNARPCPLAFDLRDTTCASGGQTFRIHVDDAPGTALGTDVRLSGVRLMIEHPWRSDLRIWLRAPDSTRIQLVAGLNAGDKNIGDPSGDPCAQYVELTETAGALPLSAAAEHDNFTGYYLPVDTFGTLHNGQNPNGIWLLEICDAKANDKGKLRLFGLVFAQTGCAGVDSVSAGNVTESSADISWIDDGTGDSLIVEYGPAGFYPGVANTPGQGGTVIALAQPWGSSQMLTGLTALVHYAVFIRRQCVPGLWSANSPALHFFTNCPPTLVENPDTLPVCANACTDPCPLPGLWQNVSGDDYEWKVRQGAGITYPTAGPSGDASEGGLGKYFFFRNSCSFNGANGKKAFLRTRCVAVSAPASQPCHFSFDLYMNTKAGQMGSLALQASLDGGQSWQTLQTWTGNQGKRWLRKYVNLNAFDGQITLFQFVATGVFGAYGDIALDNLVFYGSSVAGTPEFEFYRDADSDGFGDANTRIIACNPAPPAGYVTQDSDCIDADASVYPGAPEVLCNQKDENCNGMADDGFIAAPSAQGAETCAGAAATLQAQGQPIGGFYWFDEHNALVGSGAAFQIPSASASAIYFLVDSLSGGCASARVPATLTVRPLPQPIVTEPEAFCPGITFDLNNVEIQDQANANATYTFHTALPPTLSNQLPALLVSPTATVTYQILATSPFGCTATAPVTLLVNPGPAVTIVQGDSVALCRNRSLSLLASGSGGIGSLTYAWSNGLNFPNIPIQSGNTPDLTTVYSITVSDGNGCTGTDQIKVHTLNSITQTNILAVQNVTACGGNNGTITLQPLNGQGPFDFSWSGPTTGMLTDASGITQLAGLKQGGYRVTVTDANNPGCSMVLPQIVLNAPGLQVAVDTIIHPLCAGANTGSIALAVTGTAPVFQWSNLQTGSTAVNLPAGSYAVTITDGNCVQSLTGLDVTAPPPLQIVQNGLKNVTCAGGADGAINIAVFGGTPPYAFLWSNADTTEDVMNLAAGSYTVTVTDANACTVGSAAFGITAPPTLVISADTLAPVRCFGGADGRLRIKASGGVTPYHYLWNTGSKNADLGQVAAGTYTIIVTGALGCSAVASFVVGEPDALAFGAVISENPTCVGVQNGRIEVQVEGGVGPYAYFWNTALAADTTAILENRPAGLYALTVTDAKGCTIVDSDIMLSAPQLLTLTLDSLVEVGCFGDQTGLISISVSGALPPLAITWNFQPDDLTLSNVPTGEYIVRVSDARQCMISDTFFLHEPDAPLTVTLEEAAEVLCHGEPNGHIEVATHGGTPPYQFLWSNGDTTEDLPALAAGQYALTVTDAQDCTALLPAITIGEPPALIVTPTVHDIPCFGSLTGDIQLSVTGGIPPYSFFWSTSAVTQNLFNLPAGSYEVAVVDASGCGQLLDSLTINDLSISFAVETVKVQPVSCPGAADGKLAVMALNGQAPYQFSWSPPVGLHGNVQSAIDSVAGLSGGNYAVTVTDANGCHAVSETFLVEEAPPLLLDVSGVSNNPCKGDANGQVGVHVSGGLPPYQFAWTNQVSEGPSADSLPAGVYQVTVTDLRGCSAVSVPVTISEPSATLAIMLDHLEQDVCGTEDGSIQLHVTGGQTPYAYHWSSGQSSSSLIGLAEGMYQLSVTDGAGCTLSSPVFTIEKLADPLEMQQAVVSNVDCRGDSTGSIQPNIIGGLPAYQYYWSDGGTTPTLADLPAGAYLLTVSDALGCTAVFTFNITQPEFPLAAAWHTDSLPDGCTATLDVAGGTMPYDITWDAQTGGQTGPVASGLSTGLYSATVVDAQGCVLEVEDIACGNVGTTGPQAAAIRAWLAPNPADQLTWLHLMLERPATLEVAIFTAMSQEVGRDFFPETSDTWSVPLDLKNLNAGMYWIRVGAGGRVMTIKLVKG